MKTAKQFMDEMPSNMKPSEGVEIYAKQEAIEFAIWLNQMGYVSYRSPDLWVKIENAAFIWTIEQLYKIWKYEMDRTNDKG